MNIDKYNIDYSEIKSKDKPVFTFVNHKTAVLCWAKLAKKTERKLDVVHFDSHGDFRGGLINGEDPTVEKGYFGSKYISHLKHFSNCKEFLSWNLLDNEQNTRLITKERKFLTMVNDNFIDVAFMKDIIANAYWYFFEEQGNIDAKICDDINGKDHNLVKLDVKKFKQPKNPFILDIDLDFFVKDKNGDCKFSPIPDKEIKKYLTLEKKLLLDNLCVGLTIALEPGCCGGIDNCLFILKNLCDVFDIDIISESRELIKKSQES